VRNLYQHSGQRKHTEVFTVSDFRREVTEDVARTFRKDEQSSFLIKVKNALLEQRLIYRYRAECFTNLRWPPLT
jgi:hypothetical protein